MKKMEDKKALSVEEKLKALFELQSNNTEIDKIRILRGELPLEVADLEDDIAGLQTRIGNLKDQVKELADQISEKKNQITESTMLIKKYEEQQMNVRNNREFDSLTKEIEFQKLEIELAEKRINEFTAETEEKNSQIEMAEKALEEREADLAHKTGELDDIVAETSKEEELLMNKSSEIEMMIEPRLLTAYKRIRANAQNGLAVVSVERDACGGCFNKIPPQRQLDIRSRKKIIVCEYCGRILVDHDIAGIEE